MNSLWNNQEAQQFKNNLLALRVYTSRLLGKNADLVLHGGGNTSVKIREKNAYGEAEDILYIKGSGWDLATIEQAGFAPVKMDALLKMAAFKKLSDKDMVDLQRAAMTNPNAPNPSVEAILHAIIPFTFVDHTHADVVVTVSNTPGGEQRIKEIFGSRALIIPYVMPGFVLAKKVYEMTQSVDWNKVDVMILMNHGIFTFDNDGRKSYERMIAMVSKAENYLKKKKSFVIKTVLLNPNKDLLKLAHIRREVSKLRGQAQIVQLKTDALSFTYGKQSGLKSVAGRGPLTPDHIIRTKRVPVILSKDIKEDFQDFAADYKKYFNRFKNSSVTMLDAAPRWAVWPGVGTLCFGSDVKELEIISDITDHTMTSILRAEKLGGWRALGEEDLFEVEYWELEQAKLKKQGKGAAFQGKIALVTGAASGIGKACVEWFVKEGACVVAVDIDPKIKTVFHSKKVLTLIGNLTKESDVQSVIDQGVERFGGLDIVVSNAGIFPKSASVESMDQTLWEQSLKVNLTSHELLMKHAVKYLAFGIDPTIIIIASKNVPAPGPGASAYSVAKAGLTQLGRVAALELASKGIRVNMLHPNQVFDTAIWTDEVLKKRAENYRMSVEEYKKSNLLKTEITSQDVARLVTVMAGPAFYKTTGAQVPIDGGNERVI
jgi:rhamnose utilization protein RhaD (predicted bifunctional aldolase and dehydrogenase)/NAD(P)-dependent dehydrogenase (short-subunit alcohol dehydrogenase family)